MPDGNLKVFVEFLSGLPAELGLCVLIRLAVTLEFLPQHLAVLIDKDRPLIEQLFCCRNVTGPCQVRH